MAEVEDFLNRRINEQVNAVVKSQITELYSVFAADSEEAKLQRRQLAIINTKDLITISEAAILIGCSESTIRKKVEETRKFFQTQTRRGLSLVDKKPDSQPFDPIPFIDKSKVGIILFERVKLIEWIKTGSPDRQERKEVA